MSDAAEDDGFVDLTPPTRGTPTMAPVILSTFRMGRSERLQISIDRTLFTADRAVLSWNPKTFTLRISPDPRGAFAFMNTPGVQTGKRGLFKMDLPPGLVVVERKEPGPHRFDGKALFIVVPPPMRVPPPKVDAVAVARASIPAPSFSTAKR